MWVRDRGWAPRSSMCPRCSSHLPSPLTVVVAFDRAHKAEELDDPAEAALHLLHKDAGQELGAERGSASLRGQGRGQGWGWAGRLTESMFLEMMTVTL